MTESQLYGLLTQHQLPVNPYASFALDELPSIDFFPVALKIESPKVIHKSEYGAVKVHIQDAAGLAVAKEQIIANVTAKGVTLDATDRFIAVKMARGEELFVGVVDDPIFGKVILFGKGGIFLELYKDVCYIDTDANETEIRRALATTKVIKLFEGFRGGKASVELAVGFIQKVQSFLKARPDIAEMDFNPVMLDGDQLTIVDCRIQFAPAKPASTERNDRPSFFKNQRVAIIGASTDPSKVGYAVAKNAHAFTGELFYVNTKGGELLGRPLYTSTAEIPGDIDTAVITLPSKFVFPTIEALIPKGLKNLVIISAGFKEVGDMESEDRIAQLAATHHFNVIGPNCLGYYEATRQLNVTFGPGVLPGSIALLSQSGAVLTALMDKAHDAGIGFSHIVSMGNMVDLDFAEAIDMLQDEPTCEHICVYAEGIQRGKAFLQTVRRSKKPIYLFKTGKSEASKKAAFSHTGNLSGNYAMFKGLLESVGVKIEDNIEALIFNPLNVVDDILIITNAGGPATILTDYVVDKGKRLYELSAEDIARFDAVMPSNWSHNNPVDIIGDAMSDRYLAALEIADTLSVGLIYLVITPQFMTDTLAIVKLLERPWNKRILPVLLGGYEMEEAKTYLRTSQKPFFKTMQSATSFL